MLWVWVVALTACTIVVTLASKQARTTMSACIPDDDTTHTTQDEMKQAAEQAKKRNAWEGAGGDDQDKAMELVAGKVGGWVERKEGGCMVCGVVW